MTGSVIVKVSNKSNLVIRHNKVFRAISIEELVRLSKSCDDCRVVIIENIKEDEEEKAKKFVHDFCSKDANNRVVFYIPDNDEITSGIADELEYDICLTAREVYNKVNEETGLNISPFLADRELSNNKTSDVEDIFGTGEKSEEIIAVEKEPITADSSILKKENKDTPEENEKQVKVDINKREETEAVERKEEEEKEEEKQVGTVEKIVEKVVPDTKSIETINAQKEEIDNQRVEIDLQKEEIDNQRVEIDLQKEEIDRQQAEISSQTTKLKEQREEIDKLVGELDEYKEQYSLLLADMKQATERIEELEKVIKSLSSEKKAILDNFNNLVASDEVCEEIIDSAELSKALTSLDKSNARIVELETELSKLNAEVAEYEKKVVELTDTIKDSEEKIKNTIEEYDAKVSELNGVIDDTQSKLESTTTEYNTKVEELTCAINEAETKFNNAGEMYSAEISTLKSAKEESDKLNSEISQICGEQAKKIDVLSNKIIAEIAYREATIVAIYSTLQKFKIKVEELQEVTNERDELLKKVADCENTILELNNRLSEQSSMLTDGASKISESEMEIEELRHEIAEKCNSIKLMQEQISSLNNEITDKDTELSIGKSALNQHDTDMAAKDIEIAKRQAQIEKLIAQVDELTQSLKQKSEECLAFMQESVNKDETIKELTESQSSLKKRAELANNYAEEEKTRMQALVDKANAKAKLLEDKIKEKEEEIEKLKNNAVNIEDTILDMNDELGTSNETLKEKLAILSKEVTDLRNKNEQLAEKLESSESENRGYKEIIRSNEGKRVNPVTFNNQGAQIISIFGSGSVGVTTTAMSIASRLSTAASVLYMDFDIVSPSSDAWFRKSPFCSSIANVGVQESTALGVVVEHGIGTFSNNMAKLVNTVESNKGGGLDYFSGLYYRPDDEKIVNADFTNLFNILSSRYNYIIIDLGRLGNSELNDSLIKAMADISTKAIAVTTPDRFEIRNFNLKLRTININRINMCWLFNMCTQGALDSKSMELVGGVPTAYMLFDTEIRGRRENFLKTRLNKDSFEMFLKSSVFGRK